MSGHPSELEAIASAASAAVSPAGGAATVSGLAELRVQEDSAVYRGLLTIGPASRSVVVKVLRAGEGAIRERAALELAHEQQLPGVVQLLGASDERPLAVLEDLGEGPSLASRLLAGDPHEATAALRRWVEATAGLQAASRSLGAPFLERMARLGAGNAPALDETTNYVRDLIPNLASALSRLGVALPDDAVQELRLAGEALAVTGDSATPAGLIPGDTCPDNAIDMPTGTVLIDFEGAQFRHVAWEMAYLTVPWPTCWCSWGIPPAIVGEAVTHWRRLLSVSFPAVMEPSFGVDLARATMIWSAQWVSHSLGPAIDGAERPRFHEGLAPSRRATVPARLRILEEDAHGVCPSLAAVAADARRRCIQAWGELPLHVAPAWRGV